MAGDKITFRLFGAEELRRTLARYRQEIEKELRKLVSDTATRIRKSARMAAPEDTGALRRALRKRLRRRGARATVSQKLYYASFVELGTKERKEDPYLRDQVERERPGFYQAVEEVVFRRAPQRARSM